MSIATVTGTIVNPSGKPGVITFTPTAWAGYPPPVARAQSPAPMTYPVAADGTFTAYLWRTDVAEPNTWYYRVAVDVPGVSMEPFDIVAEGSGDISSMIGRGAQLSWTPNTPPWAVPDGRYALLGHVHSDYLTAPEVAAQVGITSVRAMGAVGDGVTDDTAALAAALGESKLVYLPPGIYKISDTLNLAGHTLIGAGRHVSEIRQTATDKPVLSVTTSSGWGSTIEGLRLIGGANGGGATTAQHGIVLTDPAGHGGTTIRRCEIGYMGGHGIVSGKGYTSVNNVLVDDCMIYQNNLDGICMTYGGTAQQVNAIWIEHCDISFNKGNGITFSGNAVSIHRNTIQANTNYAVQVGTAALDAEHFTYASSLTGNYTEQNGAGFTTNGAIIGVYAGRDNNPASQDRRTVPLEISNNYFAEAAANLASIIRVIDLKNTSGLSTASIQTRNNFGSKQILSWDKPGAVSMGTTLDEAWAALMPDSMITALPANARVRNWGELQGTVTNNLGAIADGASQTFTISVPWARPGQQTTVAFSATLSKLTATAYVKSYDTVEVVVRNQTGASVTLPSGTWTARVSW